MIPTQVLISVAACFLGSLFILRQCAPPLVRLSVPSHSNVTLILLGHALMHDCAPSQALLDRIRVASSTYSIYLESGKSVGVIFSGGIPRGRRAVCGSEAHVMKRSLLKELNFSTPPTNWVLEESSTTTYENALFSLRKIEHSGDVAVITNVYHQSRASWVFSCLTKRTVFSLSQGPEHSGLYENVREIVALAYYAIRGQLCFAHLLKPSTPSKEF